MLFTFAACRCRRSPATPWSTSPGRSWRPRGARPGLRAVPHLGDAVFSELAPVLAASRFRREQLRRNRKGLRLVEDDLLWLLSGERPT